MNTLRFILIAALPLFAPQHIFAQGAAAPGAVVGRMGTVELRAAQLTDLIAAQTPDVRKALAARPEALKDLVNAELLRRSLVAEARQAQWDKRPDVALAMERARDQTMIESFVTNRSTPEAAYPSASEIQTAYDQNLAQFQVPAQIHLAQILIRLPEKPTAEDTQRADALIREVSAKVTGGGDFAALAKQYSQDQASKDKGGVLDWIPEAGLNPAIREETAMLQPGSVSRALKTVFGWQIIKVLERKPVSTRSLQEVREAIVKGLRDARTQENRQRFVDALAKRAPPSVDDNAIKAIRIP